MRSTSLSNQTQNQKKLHSLSVVNQLLLKLLYVMENEAPPIDGDYPTGLWWYVGHLDRAGTARKVNHTEVAWSHRMQEMLQNRGFRAEAECAYPSSLRQRCDIVVGIGKRRPLWVEVKGSWREVFDPGRPNPAFLKYLHATAKDAEKLMALGSNVACGVALVLVDFDREAAPITEEHVDIVRKKTPAGVWEEAYKEWQVRKKLDFRTRCWVWSRWIK